MTSPSGALCSLHDTCTSAHVGYYYSACAAKIISMHMEEECGTQCSHSSKLARNAACPEEVQAARDHQWVCYSALCCTFQDAFQWVWISQTQLINVSQHRKAPYTACKTIIESQTQKHPCSASSFQGPLISASELSPLFTLAGFASQ